MTRQREVSRQGTLDALLAHLLAPPEKRKHVLVDGKWQALRGECVIPDGARCQTERQKREQTLELCDGQAHSLSTVTVRKIESARPTGYSKLQILADALNAKPSEDAKPLCVEDLIDHRQTYAPRCIVLVGAQGIGKKHLVAELLERLKEHARFEWTLQTSLGPQPGNIASTLAQWREQAGDQLDQLVNRPALVIVHDVHSPEDLRPLSLWGGQCAGVVTTHTESVARALEDAGALILEVPGLSESEARSCIRSILDDSFDPAVADQIICLAAGSPFLLHTSLALIRHEAADGEWLRTSWETKPELLLRGKDDVDGSSPPSQLARLTGGLSPRLRRQFAQLSAFSSTPGAGFELAAAAATMNIAFDEARKALDAFCRIGLLVCTAEQFRFSHTIHHLHAARLAVELGVGSAPRFRHARHYTRRLEELSARWQGTRHQAEMLKEFDGWLAQVEAALGRLGSLPPADICGLVLASSTPMKVRSVPEDWVQWTRRAIEAAVSLPDPRAEVLCRLWWVQAQAQLGLAEEALKTSGDCVGLAERTGDAQLLCAALNNHGALLVELRRFDDAVPVLERVQFEAESLVRSESTRALLQKSWGNLGVSYQEREPPDVARALAYHRKQRAWARETGDRHRETYARTNIGWCLVLQGEYDQGIKQLRDSIRLSRQLGNHAALTPDLRMLGEAYRRRAERAVDAGQRRESYLRAIQAFREALALAVIVDRQQAPRIAEQLEQLAGGITSAALRREVAADLRHWSNLP